METQAQLSQLSFPKPLDMPRPRHSHFFTVWSPKLNRRLSFYHALVVDAWVLLESDPKVRLFCERPHATKGKRRRLVVDFWVDHSSHQEFLFVAPSEKELQIRQEVTENAGFMDWSQSHGVTVRIWPEAEIRANTTALENWKTILHCLAANARFVPPGLPGQILALLRTPQELPLNDIIQQLDDIEPMLARTGVFQMLARGQLVSNDVLARSLGHDTGVRLP